MSIQHQVHIPRAQSNKKPILWVTIILTNNHRVNTFMLLMRIPLGNTKLSLQYRRDI